MAPSAVYYLEQEDHARDASFNKVLHGASAEKRGGMMAMLKKDAASQKAAVDEYFKHWDNKAADVETEDVRKARRDEYATLTRQYACFETLGIEVCANGFLATTTSPPTSTNMAGGPPSISVVSLMVNLFTAPSPATNTI